MTCFGKLFGFAILSMVLVVPLTAEDHKSTEKEVAFKYVIEGKEKDGRCKVSTIDLGGNVKLEMVRIGKGKFEMGSPKTEEGRKLDEKQRKVTIEKDFYLGRYEVTQEQYEAIMEKNPSELKGKRLPVENVTWHEAKEFCEKLSRKTGKKFVLPNEKQWEYACRAGTTTPFHFGSSLNGDLANCSGIYPYGTTTKGKFLMKTSEVGSYPANPWGLYDMHGNVFEWCEDWYTIEHEFRVMRGGSCHQISMGCRAARRGGVKPGTRNIEIGFRILQIVD